MPLSSCTATFQATKKTVCCRKMSKISKKRKHKKSSSSEEDEKSSKERDTMKNYKSGKKKQYVNSQESGAAKQEKCALPTGKDVSQSTRPIKRPVYRMSKTQSTDQKPAYKQEERTKPKHDISSKDITVSRCKTVEREPSKPSKNASTVPQRREKTSKGSTDKKSTQSSTSKLMKQQMSPSLVSAEQKEQRQDVLKKKCRAEEPPRTGNERHTVTTREPSKASSVSKDSSCEKRRELFKKMCQRHQENKAKRSPCTEAKTPSVSTSKNSSTSSKQSTSVNSSNVVKNVRTIPGNVTSMSYKTVKSSSAEVQIGYHPSLLPIRFKISKKVQPRPVDCTRNNNGASVSNRNLKLGTEPSDSGASRSKATQETVQRAPCCLDVTPSSSSEGQDKRSYSSGQPPSMSHTVTEPWYDQMQVVEELHLARSEKRLEVNVLQSYGELTCMDIDPPEEGAADTHCKQPPQQDLILVLDTNILLSHLDYVEKIKSLSLGALGVPIVLIPWVVLQELDSLKRGKGMSGSVAHLATPAISYIYNSLKNREPHLWGQSMQQASESSNGLNAENNDDRVLQCCLQYQSLYPECALILCTNDKNLCSKALLSGVKALSKNDLEAEIGKSRRGFHPPRNIKSPMLPHVSPHLSSPMQSRSYTPAQPHSQERTGLSVEEKVNKRLSTNEDEEKTKWNPSSVSELEDCLRDVLSDVLEVEMKAAYEDLWLEIVYIKPPWTLKDVLQCLKKHWIAVFGQVVPRRKLQNVLNLIEFFNSGETANRSSTSAALQEAKELVKVFLKSSRLVPNAISIMDNIYNKLHPQSEPPPCDVVMNDNDEEKQPTSAQVSHQEVWALFENIWSCVFQISLEVFKALGFDPHTMQRPQPAGGPPPPQDALVCLHKLSSTVSQLLQAFSRVLSSAPGLEEVQALLGIILSNKIVEMDSRLTAKDLLDCFSQQDYKEKLRVGGNQLMGLKEALDCCVGTTGQHINFTTAPP
ncbi:transcriptional protein SWT1 [Anoplopoma fimbria]|uniref:transcriptional protein SWT1 n=1 Tax=Anoplopoma fimbria TaxID=229290 RepID=UPI0023EB08B3|nr:transcriptional protein SWT1 [Anoplopoma fimbria]